MTQLVRSIGVVGAGTMGRGIAELAARSGFIVTLHDAVEGAADRSMAAIADRLARDVAKARMTEAEAASVLRRVSIAGLEVVAAADLVIEAIREDLEVKRSLFRDLSRLSPTAILATNTSSLAVSAIAETVNDPRRFAGLHFFNPPTRMRVVEIVRGARTSEATIAALRDVSATLGQRAFVVADTPGFLVNHIGRAFAGEALRLLDEGIASAAELDRIARDALHFRMGPFELLDLVGLDVSAEVTEQIWRGFGEEPRFRPAPIARRRVAEGLLGRKSGRGFYEYDAGGRTLLDPEPIVAGAPAPVRLVGFRDGLGEKVARLLPTELVTTDPEAITLIGPIGSDVAREARRHGLDAQRTVGIDPIFTDLATLAGPTDAASAVAAAIRAAGHRVAVVADGPGMPAQRIAAMMVLVAAEAAAAGIGSPEDIDAAVRLALAYPQGPLELGDAVGAKRIAEIAAGLFALTGDRRWRPSPWLDRYARSGSRMAQSQLQQELAAN